MAFGGRRRRNGWTARRSPRERKYDAVPSASAKTSGARVRPPQRNLPPPGHPHDVQDVERRAGDALEGNDVEGNSEALRHLRAVARVPVEELDHARGLTGRAHPLLEGLVGQGIDEPAGPVHDERMRVPFEKAHLAPAEAVVELVATLENGHLAGKPYRN